MKELELLSLDGLKSFFKRNEAPFTPEPGSVCANCQTELKGLYCYSCGQTADAHKRSILRLIWETIEGLFNFDSRLWNTLPHLFFRPGVLNRDLLERRIARHVPPLRLFLVALLLFMFAAEHKIDQTRRQGIERAQQMQTEAGKRHATAVVAARVTYNKAVKAAKTPAGISAARTSYHDAVKQADQARDDALALNSQLANNGGKRTFNPFAITQEQARAMVMADQAAQTGPKTGFLSGFANAAHKAMLNLDLFYITLSTWGQRLAILLLPIMGLSLTLLYAHRRTYYIYDHLLVSANLLSFLFLSNALAFALPDAIGGLLSLILVVWTPVNIFMTLRGAYGSSIAGAAIKSVITWALASISFGLIVLGVVYLAMTSL